MFCPMCGCPDAKKLGNLGNKLWVRCVSCGMDRSIEQHDEEGLYDS